MFFSFEIFDFQNIEKIECYKAKICKNNIWVLALTYDYRKYVNQNPDKNRTFYIEHLLT